MAEQDCNSPPKSIVITSPTDDVDAEKDKFNPMTSTCESRLNSEKITFVGEKNVSCNNQSPRSNLDAVSSEDSVKTATDNRNGVSEVNTNKISPFLRPSPLSLGSKSGFGGIGSESPSVELQSKCPLKSPTLNLTPSRLGNLDNTSSGSSTVKLPFQQIKSPFSNPVLLDIEKNDSAASNSQSETGSGVASGETNSKSLFGFTSTKPVVNSSSSSSSVLSTNFVFGQNLHERVADGVSSANSTEKKSETKADNSNGTSDMLFTSVLTSKEIKDNLNSDSTKEQFSLAEDAARCEEARANKRKYEEVLVTTGEEDEENILQVNVKLFAFDSGAWVERGRGTLRLNDKSCDGTVLSRIVIRTAGSLRVVLNTKIWSGMSLSRASQRSIRLTAMDPNGQLKIFLIQASPKDMGTLYRCLDIRLKRCQENEDEPERKKQERDEKDEEEDSRT